MPKSSISGFKDCYAAFGRDRPSFGVFFPAGEVFLPIIDGKLIVDRPWEGCLEAYKKAEVPVVPQF